MGSEVFKINKHSERGMVKKKKVKHPLIAKHAAMSKGDVDSEIEEKGNVKEDEDEAAKSVAIQYVSITSFNEWHEGTQIEPSVAKQSKNGFKYLDFEQEGGASAYMDITKD